MKKLLKLFTVIFFITVITSCNKKPDLPVCISPKDGATNITDSVLVLEWECSDPNGDELVFDVFLSESEEGIITQENEIVSATKKFSCEVKNLKDNTAYYWQVEATDPAGRFSLNAWQFKTGVIQK